MKGGKREYREGEVCCVCVHACVRVRACGPKNQRVIILNGHDPDRAADVEAPIIMHAQWLKVY